ncbi:MAG: hypothetical protein IPJ68_05870 [Candidatus Moraniibacteriota bacterium]|nr:MAG: hypothetical protein IPJ68_05870 [Candidatus Moranbacteria bacterium]
MVFVIKLSENWCTRTIIHLSNTPGIACGKEAIMAVNFTNCAWADLAHAGWRPSVVARKGDSVTVVFTGPQGLVETRAVPVERLGRVTRAQLDRVAPVRRAPAKLRVRIH